MVRHITEKTAVGKVLKVYEDGNIEVSGYGRYPAKDWLLLREKDNEEMIADVLNNLGKINKELDKALAQREEEAKRNAEQREKRRAELIKNAEALGKDLAELDKLSPAERTKVLEQRQAEAKLKKALSSGKMSFMEFVQEQMKILDGKAVKDEPKKAISGREPMDDSMILGMIKPSGKGKNDYDVYKVDGGGYGTPTNAVGTGYSSGGGVQIKEKFIHTKDGFILNG